MWTNWLRWTRKIRITKAIDNNFIYIGGGWCINWVPEPNKIDCVIILEFVKNIIKLLELKIGKMGYVIVEQDLKGLHKSGELSEWKCTSEVIVLV